MEPSQWLEFDWEIGSGSGEIGSGRGMIGSGSGEIGSGCGEMGVCPVLRVEAPGEEKHLLTMQKRENKFSFVGSNI